MKMIRPVKEMMIDDLMAWDSELHGNVHIENIEQVTHGPPSAAEHNFVGSVDSMSTLHCHALSAANNPAAVTHDFRIDPADVALGATSRFDVFAAVAIPNTTIHKSLDFSLAESTAMETFWLDMDGRCPWDQRRCRSNEGQCPKSDE
jgi:hypothetical protein